MKIQLIIFTIVLLFRFFGEVDGVIAMEGVADVGYLFGMKTGCTPAGLANCCFEEDGIMVAGTAFVTGGIIPVTDGICKDCGGIAFALRHVSHEHSPR
eukprot:m.23967 g.23967  ORF g.23967 m.23967 type:complete len:98 (+) comp5600_c0_seq5:434-727(+)